MQSRSTLRRGTLRVAALALALLFAGALLTPAYASGPTEHASVDSSGEANDNGYPATIHPDVLAAIEADGSAHVFLNLETPELAAAHPAGSAVRSSAIASTQAAVLANPAAHNLEVTSQYSHVPAMVTVVTAENVSALAHIPEVVSVTLAYEMTLSHAESVPLINADDVHTLGYTGEGVQVAVIDSGIDSDHPDLADDLMDEYCYLVNVSGTCPGGGTTGNSAEDTGGTNASSHGTHVAGTVSSAGTVAPVGVAPDAELIAVKVFTDEGAGIIADTVGALNWLIANHATLGTDVVNMSLGATGIWFDTQSACSATFPSFQQAVDDLTALGVTVVAASGNEAKYGEIGAPACLENVIAVGATYDATLVGGWTWSQCTDTSILQDALTCFTNRNALVDVLAPGAFTTSSNVGGGTSINGGTSMASPHVAATAALLRDVNPTLTPAQIELLLETETNVNITDSETGLTFPRIDALRAVEAAQGGNGSAGTTERVSVDSNEVEGNDASAFHSISADGDYVAFASTASNLVPGDTNDPCDNAVTADPYTSCQDIFVRNRLTGETTRVSVASDGTQANDWSGGGLQFGETPSISGDGRYVAFGSWATNLVAGDTNAARDIFVHDTQTGQTTRVSIATGGIQAESGSAWPAISADGRYVTFSSGATNLVTGDTNGFDDVFVHDTQTGTTTLISVATDGTQANDNAIWPSISADGRYVTFETKASNLVAGDTNDSWDVFVHDTQTGTTTRASVATDGTQSNGNSGGFYSAHGFEFYLYRGSSISGDGRYVVFTSDASNLVVGDTNNAWDVFLHDTQTGTTTLVPTRDGSGGLTERFSPAISSDGRYVVFSSAANTLVESDTNNANDIFVFDTLTSETTRVSVDSSGVEGDENSGFYSISGDGRYVAFGSMATNLVADDTNDSQDIFVHDREGTPVGKGTLQFNSVTLSAAENAGGVDVTVTRTDSSEGAVSVDVAITGGTATAGADYTDPGTVTVGFADGDSTPQTVTIPLLDDAEIEGDESIELTLSNPSGMAVLGANSTAMVTISDDDGASGNVPNHSFEEVLDPTTNWTTVGTPGRLQFSGAVDGEYVAFFVAKGGTTGLEQIAPLTGLAGDQVSVTVWFGGRNTGTNGFIGMQVFLLNGDERVNSCVNVLKPRTSTFPATELTCTIADASAEFTHIHMRIGARNVTGKFGFDYVTLEHTSTDDGGTSTVPTHRISVDDSGAEGNGSSYWPAISADGRYVAFHSYANNLVPDDTNGVRDVFLHDTQTGELTRISVDSTGAQGDNTSRSPSISADGRYVAFYSDATNLVTGDTNGYADIFVHDTQTGITTRVSVDSSGIQADGPSLDSNISPDGRYVAFASDAANLIIGDTNGMTDIFVHDTQTGETTRVSVDSSGTEGNGASEQGKISENGRYVTYSSEASNLVAGDTNGASDIFVHDMQTGTTTRLSVDTSGTEGNSDSFGANITPDGRYVTFYSWSSNLIIGDTNGTWDVFLHDTQTGETTRVSVDGSGAEANGVSWGPNISADGRYVAFLSNASNLVTSDTNNTCDNDDNGTFDENCSDIFVHDTQAGTTIRISVDSDGLQANGASSSPAISADGLYVAFTSIADNLVGDDTNAVYDIFVHGPIE